MKYVLEDTMTAVIIITIELGSWTLLAHSSLLPQDGEAAVMF